jgi:hypothetical protein
MRFLFYKIALHLIASYKMCKVNCRCYKTRSGELSIILSPRNLLFSPSRFYCDIYETETQTIGWYVKEKIENVTSVTR